MSFSKTGNQYVEHMRSPDNAKFNGDVQKAQDFADELAGGTSQAEKDLVRKVDWRILPCCWVLSLLVFLDRANIGHRRVRSIVVEHHADF